MAEEFNLSVSVDADMAKFRATLRAELEAAQKQGATIPVGATTGAAGTSVVPPGGTGVSPGASLTANSVAQQSAQAVANAAARAGVPFTGTISGMSPAAMATQTIVAAAQSQRMSWASAASVFGADMVGNPQMAAAAAAAVGGGGVAPGAPVQMPPMPFLSPFPGGGGRGGGRSFLGSGSRLFGVAMLAHAVAGTITAEMQYGRDTRLAQGDPNEIIKAELAHRQSIADAWSVPGHIGLAIREAVTGEEESVQRVMRDTNRINDHTMQMRTVGEMSRDYREAGQEAGLRGSAQRRAIAAHNYEGAAYTINNARAAAAEETHKRFEAQRADVETEYQRRLGPAGRRNNLISKPGLEAWHDAQLQAITTAENDAVAKNKTTFGAMLSSAQAVKARAIADIDRNVQATDVLNYGAARGSFLRAAGRPFEASVSEHFTRLGAELLTSDDNKASIGLRGVASMAELFADMFRDVSNSHRQLTAQNRVTQKLLDRDPLGARIASIQSDTSDLLATIEAKVPAPLRGPLQAAARYGGRLRQDLASQENDDAHELRLQSLNNRTEHYNLLAQGKPFTAQVKDVQRQMEEDINEMRMSKRYSEDEITGRIRLGISQERALVRGFQQQLNAGMGQVVAPGTFAPGTQGVNPAQEPLINALTLATKVIEDLTAAIGGLMGGN